MLIRATYAGVGAIYHQVNRDDIYVFILLTIKVIIFSRLYWHSTIQPTGSTQCFLSFVALPSSSVEDQLTISQIITRPTILDRQNVDGFLESKKRFGIGLAAKTKILQSHESSPIRRLICYPIL